MSSNVSTATISRFLFAAEDATGLSPIASATLAVVSAGILASFIFPSSQSRTGPRELGGFSILTAWPFFNRRYDFIWKHFKATGERMFRFNVLHHAVVAMRGEESRKAFFGDKNLSFTEGYKILMGGSPDLKDIDITTEISGESVAAFNKRLLTILLLPQLFDDVNRRMLDWGKEGRINPFQEVYDLVFQMTVRMATCSELAEDKDAIKKLADTYWRLEKSATPVALLLPWFPGSAKKAKEEATTALFTTLAYYVGLRREAGASSADAIDLLFQEGCDDMTIIQFVLNVIFAGVINTGINSCWDMIYLASSPEWKGRVVSEVNSLLEKYTPGSTEPIHQRLSSIPISAWEDEMPAMDLVIRETLRLTLSAAALRRNVLEDLKVDGKVIKKGDFLAYSLADVHLNPEIYSEPLKFDPSRFEAGREEDKKGTWSFLGWGSTHHTTPLFVLSELLGVAGRHPCAGMKVAKLEIKVIVAMFVAAYEFDLVDETGSFPKSLPQPDP
ncbi:hypothetical protein ONZ45_g407 [Pleurotus djamor]|nr:hypothetical protein ONZ45_g407 [Pleurotus djamor]